MLGHVLPNVFAPILVIATVWLGNAIVIEAALSFLGLGTPPPTPTWGGMLERGGAAESRERALPGDLSRRSPSASWCWPSTCSATPSATCSTLACARADGCSRRTRVSEPKAAIAGGAIAMPARTGEDFLRGLKDDRRVWVGDDRVSDVAGHPAFAGAARFVASLFDLQHEAAAVCLMPDPETGEPINVSHLIPRSRQDLERRHACLERIAEWSVGIMGRTPDYMNITFAGFAGREDEWSIGGNERGAANLVAYQKLLARRDLSLTHTLVHPTVDRAWGDAPAAGNDVALHKVADTAHGIVVRGARDPGHPRPVRRRAGGLSGRAAARREPTPTRSRSRSRWPRPASSSSAATA